MKRFLTLFAASALALTASAQLQIQNPSFEEWDNEETSSVEPSHWNSFMSGTGAMKGFAAAQQVQKSDDAHSGNSSARIYARSVFGVVAQGNLTTGCINMGSATATDANGNYNYTNEDDANFHQKFTGLPDAMRVWVKASCAYPAGASCNLHTTGYFQDPAGNTITKEIAQAFGCSFEEAEQLKLERGYVSLGGVTEDEDEITDRVSKIIRTVLTRVHAEISRSINFYRSQQGGAAPSRIFLTGGSVRLPQLDQFFMETLQVNVEYLNPFTSVRVGGKVDAAALESDAFTLAESVGLALRQTDVPGLIRIDLMPPELVAQARNVRRIPFLVTGAACLLAALGLGIVMQNRECAIAKAQLEEVQSQNSALEGKEKQLKSVQGQEKAEMENCDKLQKLMRTRMGALARVRAVQASLLPGMWISKWEYVPPSGGDDSDGLEGVKIVVCGWKDAMKAGLKKWKDDWKQLNPDRKVGNVNVARIIKQKIEASGIAALPDADAQGGEAVSVELQPGKSLEEITLAFKFAPVKSIDSNAPAKKNKNRRGRR